MKLESEPAANQLLYSVIITVGSVLMYLARDFPQGGTNLLCGFLLGCMLAGLGVLGMIIGEARTVELDEQRKRIVLDVRRRLGGSRQLIIPFRDIAQFAVGTQGKASAGSRFYDLVVILRTGGEIHLFGGCVFAGRMNRDWVEGVRHRFEQAVFAQRTQTEIRATSI